MRTPSEARADLVRALTWSEIVSEDPAWSGAPLYELTPEQFALYRDAMPRAFGQLARGEEVDPRLPLAGFDDLVAERDEWLVMAKIVSTLDVDDLRAERRKAMLYAQVRATVQLATIDRESLPDAAEYRERRIREATEERDVLGELAEDRTEAIDRLRKHPPGGVNHGRSKRVLPRLAQIELDGKNDGKYSGKARVWKSMESAALIDGSWLVENLQGWSIRKAGRTGNPRGRPSSGQRREDKVAARLEEATGLPLDELKHRLDEQEIRDRLRPALTGDSVNVATVAKVLGCHRSTVYRLRAT